MVPKFLLMGGYRRIHGKKAVSAVWMNRCRCRTAHHVALYATTRCSICTSKLMLYLSDARHQDIVQCHCAMRRNPLHPVRRNNWTCLPPISPSPAIKKHVAYVHKKLHRRECGEVTNYCTCPLYAALVSSVEAGVN